MTIIMTIFRHHLKIEEDPAKIEMIMLMLMIMIVIMIHLVEVTTLWATTRPILAARVLPQRTSRLLVAWVPGTGSSRWWLWSTSGSTSGKTSRFLPSSS